MIKDILPILEYFDSPWLWGAALLLIVIPAVISLFKSLLKFHGNYIKYYKSDSYEHALTKIKKDSSEYELFEEFKNQELFFINTKIRASKVEREQITEWVLKKPISIESVRKSWPMLGIKDGSLVPIIAWYDTVHFWYSLVAIVSCVVGGTALIAIAISSSLAPGSEKLFFLALFGYSLAILIFYQVKPLIFARRVKFRLEHG